MPNEALLILRVRNQGSLRIGNVQKENPMEQRLKWFLRDSFCDIRVSRSRLRGSIFSALSIFGAAQCKDCDPENGSSGIYDFVNGVLNYLITIGYSVINIRVRKVRNHYNLVKGVKN